MGRHLPPGVAQKIAIALKEKEAKSGLPQPPRKPSSLVSPNLSPPPMANGFKLPDPNKDPLKKPKFPHLRNKLTKF